MENPYGIDYRRGIVNRGDTRALERVMHRAMEGRTIRVAFLGGSITQGYLATEHEKCYAYRTYQWWADAFPDARVKYVNAGIGGTTSHYGVARADADVLAERPDVVFVEFSVNDSGDPFFQETYEGLVRHLLSAQLEGHRHPALVLLHNVMYDTGQSAEAVHVAVGRRYGLPCISMRSTIYEAIHEGLLANRDVTEDDLHPNDAGHQALSEAICFFLEEVRKGAEQSYYVYASATNQAFAGAAQPPAGDALPAPLTMNSYEHTQRYQHRDCDETMLTLNGFQKDLLEKQYDTDCFRGGWRAQGAGDEMVFRFHGSGLAVQYRRTVRRPALVAEVVIDGDTEHPVILDANFHEDWGDCLAITTVMHHGRVVTGQTAERVSPADYAQSMAQLTALGKIWPEAKEHEARIRILGTPQDLGYEVREMKSGGPAWLLSEDIPKGGNAGFDLVSLMVSAPVTREGGFPDGFAWGVASSAYQIEGTDPEDGRGRCIWDDFAEAGRIADGSDASRACDHMHRYQDDLRLMRHLGIRHYRFSISWSRIIPDGVGAVNEKAVAMYRDMILTMKECGITPYLTLYHWELPAALEAQGGWLNPQMVEWFGEYARVVAERFADICEYFITLNEPQCFVGLGYARGAQAPGKKLPKKDVLQIAHHALMAHGQAVINLRKYAGRPIKVGYAPTCGVAYPYSEAPEDIEAARKAYFGFYQPEENWTWNVSWYSDPVVLGHYPEEGLKKFKKHLPRITEEDMVLIHQPIDFLGQNIYNGYMMRADAKGEPEYVDRPAGYPLTASKWPNSPECLYWGMRFIYERYRLPLYVTENGVSCVDSVAADGGVHDTARIEFLDSYLGQLQRAVREGIDIRGYFLWTFLDNFEWDRGYTERFGIVWVDYGTQRRIVKDSARWYQEVIEMNGQNLTTNHHPASLLFIKPTVVERIWGGSRLKTEWGYEAPRDDALGECWAVSCNDQADGEVRDGYYAGRRLSDLWKNEPQLFGNPREEVFPLLVKIIDAKDNLSIQVHPEDAYAQEHEHSKGKRECWYILDCPEGAELIVGNRAADREELRSMVEEARWDDLLNRVPVKKGDFVQIDPGTLHAITGGILLLEVQQNSDVTYRVYDYDRLQDGKPRQLHLQQSLDVTNAPNLVTAADVVHTTEEANVLQPLVETVDYKVWTIRVDGDVEMPAHGEPFLIASVIEGDGIVDAHPVKKGDHFIIPCGYPAYRLSGEMRVNLASPVLA